MIDKNCKLCGKIFKTHNAWIKRGGGKYCSRLCKSKDNPYPRKALERGKELRRKGLINYTKRGGSEIRKCIICDNTFTFYKSALKKKSKGKYCSRKCYGLSRRGLSNHLKGTKWLKERKKKHSEIMKRIGKKPPVYYGENNNKWKGGITPINEKIRKSFKYKEWRKSVFKRDNYRCIIGGISHGNDIHADHIKPFSLFPKLRFELSNGRTLCSRCHRKTDTWGENLNKWIENNPQEVVNET